MCRKPYMVGVMPFGCGQCLPCRINKRRLWTHRMMLEAAKHANSAFVSLTYASEYLPESATLVPRHAQLWLKRLRKAVGKLRYFLVGEYGDETQRPHYHAAIFGYQQEVLCKLCRHQYRRVNCDCVFVQSWGLGNVYVGELTRESAGYVAGYVTKKLTRSDDPKLFGRHPEFARMSRKPGIGAGAMVDVARILTTGDGCQSIIDNGDVPMILQHGKKQMPLGRYLRSRLREEVGLDAEKIKASNVRRWSLEMSELFVEETENPENAQRSLTEILIRRTKQQALNQESRYKIHGRKKGVL